MRVLTVRENEIDGCENCQPIREHRFEFANPENEACQHDGAGQATRRRSDINWG